MPVAIETPAERMGGISRRHPFRNGRTVYVSKQVHSEITVIECRKCLSITRIDSRRKCEQVFGSGYSLADILRADREEQRTYDSMVCQIIAHHYQHSVCEAVRKSYGHSLVLPVHRRIQAFSLRYRDNGSVGIASADIIAENHRYRGIGDSIVHYSGKSKVKCILNRQSNGLAVSKHHLKVAVSIDRYRAEYA